MTGPNGRQNNLKNAQNESMKSNVGVQIILSFLKSTGVGNRIRKFSMKGESSKILNFSQNSVVIQNKVGSTLQTSGQFSLKKVKRIVKIRKRLFEGIL